MWKTTACYVWPLPYSLAFKMWNFEKKSEFLSFISIFYTIDLLSVLIKPLMSSVYVIISLCFIIKTKKNIMVILLYFGDWTLILSYFFPRNFLQRPYLCGSEEIGLQMFRSVSVGQFHCSPISKSLPWIGEIVLKIRLVSKILILNIYRC